MSIYFDLQRDYKAARDERDELRARVAALEKALRRISEPNWQAQPNGRDAIDMATFAAEALASGSGEQQ